MPRRPEHHHLARLVERLADQGDPGASPRVARLAAFDLRADPFGPGAGLACPPAAQDDPGRPVSLGRQLMSLERPVLEEPGQGHQGIRTSARRETRPGHLAATRTASLARISARAASRSSSPPAPSAPALLRLTRLASASRTVCNARWCAPERLLGALAAGVAAGSRFQLRDLSAQAPRTDHDTARASDPACRWPPLRLMLKLSCDGCPGCSARAEKETAGPALRGPANSLLPACQIYTLERSPCQRLNLRLRAADRARLGPSTSPRRPLARIRRRRVPPPRRPAAAAAPPAGLHRPPPPQLPPPPPPAPRRCAASIRRQAATLRVVLLQRRARRRARPCRRPRSRDSRSAPDCAAASIAASPGLAIGVGGSPSRT